MSGLDYGKKRLLDQRNSELCSIARKDCFYIFLSLHPVSTRYTWNDALWFYMKNSNLPTHHFKWLALFAVGLVVISACGGNPVVTPTSAPADTDATPPAATAAAYPMPSASPATEATPTPPEAYPGPVETALPAPNCASPATPLPALTEGPYFKSGSPERASLLDEGVVGTPLILTGYVLTPDCQPIANALLDFWQADGDGVYDNAGYRLRGHQFTDENGYYRLETVVPGLYPGRTEHIHVKVQPPGGAVLTTQLFFPDVTENQGDGIFSPLLLVTFTESTDGLTARFDFVVGGG